MEKRWNTWPSGPTIRLHVKEMDMSHNSNKICYIYPFLNMVHWFSQFQLALSFPTKCPDCIPAPSASLPAKCTGCIPTPTATRIVHVTSPYDPVFTLCQDWNEDRPPDVNIVPICHLLSPATTHLLAILLSASSHVTKCLVNKLTRTLTYCRWASLFS